MKKTFKKLGVSLLVLMQVAVFAPGITLAAPADQTCTTLDVASGTSTQFLGLTTTDPAGSILPAQFPGGTAGAAVVVGPTGFPGAWTSLAGADWASNNAVQPTMPAGPNPGQDGTIDTWRLFSHSFSIPADATGISSPVLHFAADNSTVVYLDGTQIGTTSSFNSITDTAPLAGLVAGSNHELKFVVKNDGLAGDVYHDNPTGVLYKTSIDYCQPNTPPSANLIIVKNTEGGNGVFNFTVAGPTASTPSVDTTTLNTGTTGSMVVTPGTYSVTEGPLGTGWTQNAGATCDNGETDPTDPSNIDIQNGDIVTCTFTNTFTPTPPPTSVSVHTYKYLDGNLATAVSANNTNFPMLTTFTSTTYGSATNAPYTLGPAGWGSDPAYQASFPNANVGASYSTWEDTSGALVSAGPACDGTHPYALQGYSVGGTLQDAQNASVTATVPNFPNLQGDEYVIVHNISCQVTPPSQLKVHILKYLDGAEATAVSANNYQFPMTATWSASNIGAGTGSYTLGVNFGGASSLYGADTASMTSPANYTTSEITDNTSQVVASADQCAAGKYLLNGYRTSAVGFADAATQTLTASAPVFTGLTADQYVIVDNSKCPTVTNGSISGMKFNDLNRNGKKDANEPGLQGWVIRLIYDNDGTTNADADTLITTATTDANGNYSFTNVAPGVYDIRETHQKGWKRMTKNPKDIVITSGSVVTGVDFGNALKKKDEKDDTSADDNRDDQSGHYDAGHGHSDYGKDQNKKEHGGNNKDH